MTENVFTTDKLRASTKARFTSVPIELSDGSTIQLAALLRLPADERKAVVTALEDFSDLPDDAEDPDTLDLAVDALERLVGLLTPDADKLLKDLADPEKIIYSNLLGEVIQHWGKVTRLGEARSSAG